MLAQQLLLPVFATAATAAAAAAAAAAPKCPTGNGVGMIVARASTEAPGPGTIGGVANNVVKALPGSTITSVDYPATLQNYQSSEDQGVAAMTKLVNEFQAGCPGAKMVMMGYSQGAQVTLDVLCGTTEANFAATPAVPVTNLAAAVVMGDPSHVATSPWNVGTAKNDGRFPRKGAAACAANPALAPKVMSICNSGDEFCDSGTSLTVHIGYVASNGDQATKFIVQKAQEAASSTGAGTAAGAAGAAGNATAPARRAVRMWSA